MTRMGFEIDEKSSTPNHLAALHAKCGPNVLCEISLLNFAWHALGCVLPDNKNISKTKHTEVQGCCAG